MSVKLILAQEGEEKEDGIIRAVAYVALLSLPLFLPFCLCLRVNKRLKQQSLPLSLTCFIPCCLYRILEAEWCGKMCIVMGPFFLSWASYIVGCVFRPA